MLELHFLFSYLLYVDLSIGMVFGVMHCGRLYFFLSFFRDVFCHHGLFVRSPGLGTLFIFFIFKSLVRLVRGECNHTDFHRWIAEVTICPSVDTR